MFLSLTPFSQELAGITRSPKKLLESQPEADTRDDFLLAQMLQLEFDKEHDTMLTAEEKHFNKHSKGRNVEMSVCRWCTLVDCLVLMDLSCQRLKLLLRDKLGA